MSTAANAPPTTDPSQAGTPLQFSGTGSAYFGIWIVNLFLSIITLGIYSAWAKVRRKKFFYQHTSLAGASFDYHARPLAILKGRMIAVGLLLAYNLLAQSNPIIALVLFLILSIAVPWLIVRSLTFNARNASYRGLRFDFFGRHGQAAKMFVLYPALAFFTLGALYPWIKQRIQTFLMNHHRYGSVAFICEATVASFYRVYLVMIACIIAVVVTVLVLAKSMLPTHLATFGAPHTMASLTADHHQALRAQQGWLTVAEGDEAAELDRALEGLHLPEPPVPPTNKMAALIGFVAIGAYALIFIVCLAYLNSRMSNLVWNHTRIAHAHFSSHQRMRDLVWIYLSNVLMLALSLGLATPFAQLRAARYRIQSLSLHGMQDWEGFVAEQKDQLRATGEEIAEMFDVDISFG